MAETVAPFMPSAAEIAACKWLTEAEVEVYATEYGRAGFTARFRAIGCGAARIPRASGEMLTFSGRAIDVPSMYIAGKSDWGVYQTPGAVDKMQTSACSTWWDFISWTGRALGAAGAAGTGEQAARRVPEEYATASAKL